ncbi:hypothetical protein Tco_1516825 [Tanacetum coccineum]
MAATSDPNITETKGKMIAIKHEVTIVANLRPPHYNKTIKVIVYRKWTSKHVQTRQPTKFCCILMDKQTGLWERTLENPTSLIFGKFIDLQEIPSENFPEHYFNFASYNELLARADMQNAILTDGVKLNFNMQEYEAIEKPVVIAVSSCWVRRFNGLQLSRMSTTHYYMNTNTPETYHIRQHYCFKAIIGDGTTTISVTCFNDQANSLTKDCNELLVELSDRDPYHLPSTMKDL